MVANFTLLTYFTAKKSAVEADRILVETYDGHAQSETTCREWFRRFKNNGFDVEGKKRSGAMKMFEDEETSWTCRIIWSWSYIGFEAFKAFGML